MITLDKPLEKYLADQWILLDRREGDLTEIRVPKRGIQKYVRSFCELVDNVQPLRGGDCYLGINPRRSENGDASAVSAISAIVFDFDPIRPKNQGSSEDQHREAITAATRLAGDIGGVLVNSGSGAHVYLPVNRTEVKDTMAITSQLSQYAQTIKEKYSTPTIRVDSTFDLPRIIRAWGTWNAKSLRWCVPLSPIPNTRADLHELLSKFHAQENINVQPKDCLIAAIDNVALRERFDKLVATNRFLKNIMERKASYESRSEADYDFIRQLVKANFSVAEMVQLARLNPLGKASERKPREIEQEVLRVTQKTLPTLNTQSLSTEASSYYQNLFKRKPGIMTGFPGFDKRTAGLFNDRMYVLAARPTDGKTTFLVQMATNLAEGGKKVLFFPTEVPRANIYDKIISRKAHVPLRKFQFGDFTEEDKAAIGRVYADISHLPIVVAENFSLTIQHIKRGVEETQPDIVIVDFLQSMSYTDVNDSSELGGNVVALKGIVEKFHVPLIVASQLHRNAAIPNAKPSLSNLKGTGKLEEAGDVIAFLHTKDTNLYPAKSEINIMKNKYGEPGIIPLDFFRGTCEFREAI